MKKLISFESPNHFPSRGAPYMRMRMGPRSMAPDEKLPFQTGEILFSGEPLLLDISSSFTSRT